MVPIQKSVMPAFSSLLYPAAKQNEFCCATELSLGVVYPIEKCDTAPSFPLSREGNLNSVLAYPVKWENCWVWRAFFPPLFLSASPHS